MGRDCVEARGKGDIASQTGKGAQQTAALGEKKLKRRYWQAGNRHQHQAQRRHSQPDAAGRNENVHIPVACRPVPARRMLNVVNHNGA